MARIKDIGIACLILIPFLVTMLIFERDETETIIGTSLFAIGIILYRFLNLKIIGVLVIIVGFYFVFFLNPDYNTSRYSFIMKEINPICIRYHLMLKNRIKSAFDSLIQFKHFHIIEELFYWTCVVIWLLVLIWVMLQLASNMFSFCFSLIVPIGTFVFSYLVHGWNQK